MLERLTLKNFQRYAKLEVEFDPLLTVIVGANDKGKSAILRAIRWVALNRPNGTGFIRRGSSAAVATLEVDGHRIERRRGKATNRYLLDGTELKAFGAKVPESVAELLNVEDLNFQTQLDPVFWFGQSAGQVSRDLNAIVNLGAIDSSLANIATTVRRAKAETDIAAERLKKAKARRAELRWAETAHEELLELERESAEIDEKRARLASLARCIRRASRQTEKHETASAANSRGRKLLAIAETLRKRRETTERLCYLIDEIRRADKLASVADRPSLELLEDERTELISRQERFARLSELIGAIQARSEQECRTRKLARDARRELEKNSERCPTCGQRMRSKRSSSPTST